ncbi:MAG: DUF2846 domain-containing protein [Acidobacteriia bacterium]|nr:DUF2846 domain-containing protein [Terriglobia bacterium]
MKRATLCSFLGCAVFALLVSSLPVVAQDAPPAQSSVQRVEPKVGSSEAPQAVLLEDGTHVRVRTTTFITSKKAKTGDQLSFRVATDVKVGDLVVIPRGAIAQGRVASTQKNRMMGRPGKLVLEVDSVEAITGQSVPVRANAKLKGEGYTEKAVGQTLDRAPWTAGTGASVVAVPVFFLFKGDNAEIPEGTIFTAYVNGDLPLDQTELLRRQPPPKQLTGAATVYLLRNESRGDKTPSLYCGAVEIGKLKNQHYVEALVPPGEYVFQSTATKRVVRLKAEADQTYYISFYPRSFLIGGDISIADPVQAEEALGFPGWSADPRVDLSTADRAMLMDTKPAPQPK